MNKKLDYDAIYTNLFNQILDRSIELNSTKKLSNTFFVEINEVISNYFPNLINNDIHLLFILVKNLIIQISIKIMNNMDHFETEQQWKLNNYRDIKAVINLILPFIDDKDDGAKLKSLKSLKQLFHKDTMSEKIIDPTKEDFNYCNFGIEFIRDNMGHEQLDLVVDNIHLYKTMLLHNYFLIISSLNQIYNKLMVNWINIFPVPEINIDDVDDVNSNKLFMLTWNKLKFVKEDNISEYYDFIEIETKSNTISFGDIYNTFVHDFYLSIKNFKWLLFEFRSNNSLNPNDIEIKNYFNILDEIYDLQYIFNETEFESLTNVEKNSWKTKLIDIINTTNEISTNPIENAKRDFVKSILIFMKSNYKYSTILITTYESFKLVPSIDDLEKEVKDDDNENTKILERINLSQCKTVVLELPPEHIYYFLYDTLFEFIETFYGKFMISLNKNNEYQFKKDAFYERKTENVENYRVTLKNLYNFSKSIYHKKSTEWDVTHDYYQTMDIENKEYFIKKLLLNEDLENWFNLKSNFRIVYGNNSNYDAFIKNIYDKISDPLTITRLVYNSLARRGILTEFNTFFNYKGSGRDKKEQMNKLFNKENKDKWNECYYWLTNRKFKDLKKMKISEKSDDGIHYLDLMSEYNEFNYEWYQTYTNNWMTQIIFFHKFIHNRIIYVTGATGQGKSTEVPKLVLYAVKMYLLKNNGKVICTQPRINAVEGNMDYISKTLGVPINQFTNNNGNKNIKKQVIKTDNFYCQFKHQKNEHTNMFNKNLSLKMVTDGTLLEELTNNIIMKNKKYDKNKKDFTYTLSNTYDIIMVDEAHEHNPNMDIILSLCRNSCYINNSLKLIIVSATMDDDEPIYRYYYKSINDNMTYPMVNKDSLILTADKKILQMQNINIDRRFHVSPPGETTQKIVTESYEQRHVSKKTDYKNDMKIIHTASVNRIIDICKKNPSGHILLFSTGMADILKLVRDLNKKLPIKDIALPYFSQMASEYKSKIDKMDENIWRIKNRKENIDKEWGEEYIEDQTVPNGIYKRGIIIATNVAEASITIPGLKFVVDNGFQKEKIYNAELDISDFYVTEISENSRLQRRGRVGRKEDGAAFFLYPKGDRRDNKPKYKITQQDISPLIEKLMRDNYRYTEEEGIIKITGEEENLILPKILNPNFKEWKDDKNYEYVTNDEKTDHDIEYAKKVNLIPILKNQYLIGNKPLDDTYLSDFASTDIFNVYETGFDFNTLIDESGEFYITHPNENDYFERSVNGKIISELGKKSNKIHYKNGTIKNFINKLHKRLKVLTMDSKDKNLKTYKTIFSKYVGKVGSKMKFDENSESIVMTIIMADVLDVLDDVIGMLSLMDASSFSLNSLIQEKKEKDFYKIFDDEEMIVYYKIISKIKKEFIDLDIWNLNKIKINKNDITKFNEMIKKFNNAESIFDMDQSFEPKLWSELIKLKKNHQLYDPVHIKSLIKKFKLESINIFDDRFKRRLERFATRNMIQFNVLMRFFENHNMYTKNIIDLNIKDELFHNTENPLEWFKKSLSGVSKLKYVDKVKNIKSAFLFGFIDNVCFNIKGNKYMNIVKNMTIYDMSHSQHNNKLLLHLRSKTLNNDLVMDISTSISEDMMVNFGFQVFNRHSKLDIKNLNNHSQVSILLNILNNLDISKNPFSEKYFPIINSYAKKQLKKNDF
jgi:hypothetical protein